MTVRIFADGVLVEEATDLEAEARAMRELTRLAIEDKARVALSANAGDVAQDETVQADAAAIADSPVTNLTTTQIVGVLKDLARGLVVLAGNDVNTKRELNALIRLVVGELDSTEGT